MTIGPTMISSATGRMTTSTVILNALNGIVKRLNDKGGEKTSSVFGVVSHALNGVSVLG